MKRTRCDVMKAFLGLAMSGVVGVVALSASGDTKTWRGANTVNGTNATSQAWTDVNDGTLWSGGAPGAGDTAYFCYDDTTRMWNDQIELTVGFTPGSMYIHSKEWNSPHWIPVYLRRDMNLESLRLSFGYTETPQGDKVLRIGNDAEKGWLGIYSRNYGLLTGTTRITGALGSADIDFTGKTGRDAIIAAVNAQKTMTGVEARYANAPMGGDECVYLESLAAPGLVEVLPLNSAVFPTTRWTYKTNCVVRSNSGFSAATNTLTLTGSQPLVMSSGNRTRSGAFSFGTGSRLVFSNSNIEFLPRSQSDQISRGMFGKGLVEFTAPAGTVTLSDPDKKAEGTLHVGDAVLRVRSDQTWLNPSGHGYFRASVSSGKLADSIDGGRLDNLTNVAFVSEFTVATGTQDIPAGSYRGICTTNDPSTTAYLNGGRATLRLLGDTYLAGGMVIPGDDTTRYAAESPDWSLSLMSYVSVRVGLNLNGYGLTAARGLRLIHSGAGYVDYWGNWVDGYVDASGATLDVGGLEFWETVNYAGMTNIAAYAFAYNDDKKYVKFAENRGLGLVGNANTLIRLRGDFNTNTRSLRSAYGGMNTLTLELLGGTEAEPNTFEVGSDRSENYVAGTYAIGTLNVGNVSTGGHVRLVNNYLNDNQPTNLVAQGKSKEGEVLLSVNMAIKDNSTLDLNGLGVGVSNSLMIASTAWLDLNTGYEIPNRQCVTNFWGVGDQASGWSNAASRVKDSSNPSYTFEPVYVPADNRTYWLSRAPAAGTMIKIL